MTKQRQRKKLPLPPASRMILSVADAAALFGVGESTLRDMARAKKIPHSRLGKRILFRRDALMRLLDGDGT